MSLLYSIIKPIVKVLLVPLYRVKVIGVDNIPKEGGVLLCSNHISNLDPPIVGITSPRQVHFMAKEELFKVPIIKHIVPRLNAFPVKRGFSDRQALRNGLAVLNDGNVLGLFPEGTRSKTGKLQKGLAGAGFFALRTDAVVIPCAIIGPYKIFRPLTIIYGEPVPMKELRENRSSAADATELIMGEIERLINEYDNK